MANFQKTAQGIFIPTPSNADSDPAPEELATDIHICPWLGNKQWAYAVTFDEAFSDLHRFVIPILEEFDIPGHLEVVVGQIGQARKVGNSDYNGMRHMEAEELRDMLARGWGIGNHSWTHGELNGRITAETVDLEIRQAKEVLSELADEEITVYCSPGSNTNMSEDVLDACRRYGYLGAMSITDALNRPDDEDLLWMNRTFLHHQGYQPFYSEFDPYRNLSFARHDHGWVIDYLHCPLPKPINPHKDCSVEQFRRRIETVMEDGGDKVWLARVENAVDYRYTRRHSKIEPLGDDRYSLYTKHLPTQVARKVITLLLPEDVRAAEIDGKMATLCTGDDEGILLLDVDLFRKRSLRLFRR